MSIIMISLVLLNVIFPLVSAVTQVDLRLGEREFFIGEKFLIGFSDIIWWFAGMSVGVIIAMTFIIVKEFWAFKKRMDIDSESREGRLIGSNKYPTQMEERVLKAIYTEPDNYFDDGDANRRGRLIGSWKYPTQLEHLVLKHLDNEPNNNYNMEDEATQNRQPRLVGYRSSSTYLKDTNLLPVNMEQNNYFEGDIDNNRMA